eukprot:CAMPEP_0197069738 /NCGR_PEP_ID=MMETSP1384-20130603/195283_1 /TAXON_ID=29189 /ORGANISM="Ammonia sp." /LENGTH=117 /DNA_ID=CAMNT_0042507889 /DNA_START=204 /DNA_END=553 /DNA_ORIENTATION=+
MELTQPSAVYTTHAFCNNTDCYAKIGKLEYCYHCPKGKTSVHPKGFDYCMKCAKHISTFGRKGKSTVNLTRVENTHSALDGILKDSDHDNDDDNKAIDHSSTQQIAASLKSNKERVG